MTLKSVRLFEKTDERFNLLVPLLMFGAILFCIYFQWGDTIGEILIINTITAIFLISTFHLGFTLANIIAFPEFRTFMDQQTKGAPHKLWIKWAGVYAGLLIVGLTAYNLIFEGRFFNNSYFFKAYFGFYLLASRLHTLMQIKGLLKVYNFKIRKQIHNGIETLEDKKRDKMEVTIIHLLILLSGSQAFIYSFIPRTPGLKAMEIAVLTIGFSLFAYLFWKTCRQPGVESSSKRFYLLRLPFFVVTPVHGLSTLATDVIHGIEYLYVTREMRANSSVKSSKQWLILLGVFCGFMSLTWFLSAHQPLIRYLYLGNKSSIPSFFVVFSVLNLCNAFFHFYLDGVIFRFRNPVVRKNVGPLLTGKTKERKEVKIEETVAA